MHCSSLEQIKMHKNLQALGEFAFNECKSLKSISIPNSVSAIERNAFRRCHSLSLVNLPESLVSIKSEAFTDCIALVDTIIPNSVKTIEDKAFLHCRSLTKIVIPYSITKIGEEAFRQCYYLTDISIPDSVSEIGDGAFTSCVRLQNINIPSKYHSAIEAQRLGISDLFPQGFSLPDYSELNPLTYQIISGEVVIIDCDQTYSGDLVIPDHIEGYQVKTIGNSAFRDCSLITSLKIPDSITEIGDLAFLGCSSLTGIVLPYSFFSSSEAERLGLLTQFSKGQFQINPAIVDIAPAVRITIMTNPSRSYIIQRSPDLKTWTNDGDAFIAETERIEFFKMVEPNSTFFRLLEID